MTNGTMPVYTNAIQGHRMGVRKKTKVINLRVDDETMEAIQVLQAIYKGKKNQSDLFREAVQEKAARESAKSQQSQAANT